MDLIFGVMKGLGAITFVFNVRIPWCECTHALNTCQPASNR